MTSGSQQLVLQGFSKLIWGPCNSDDAGRGILRCQFQGLIPRDLDAQSIWEWSHFSAPATHFHLNVPRWALLIFQEKLETQFFMWNLFVFQCQQFLLIVWVRHAYTVEFMWQTTNLWPLLEASTRAAVTNPLSADHWRSKRLATAALEWGSSGYGASWHPPLWVQWIFVSFCINQWLTKNYGYCSGGMSW